MNRSMLWAEREQASEEEAKRERKRCCGPRGAHSLPVERKHGLLGGKDLLLHLGFGDHFNLGHIHRGGGALGSHVDVDYERSKCNSERRGKCGAMCVERMSDSSINQCI